MPIYDVKCASGHRFEVSLASMFDDNPACVDCGAPTSRVPALARIRGTASPGPSREAMPNTWRGIGRGDADAVAHWRKAMTRREKLEEKYPELAGDRRPVLAHEGRFAGAPLRAGDALADKVAEATFGPRAASGGGTGGDAAPTTGGTP